MKVDKGVAEIKFFYPMFALKESRKACEENNKYVRKAVKHVRKVEKPHVKIPQSPPFEK